MILSVALVIRTRAVASNCNGCVDADPHFALRYLNAHSAMAQPKRSDTILVNEFLSFVQNKLDVMDELSLQQICTTSYTETEILAAKKVLADTVITSIRLVTRQRDGCGKKDLADIFRVFKETDPDDIPTYVAKDLQKLPPVTWDHVDTTRVLKDILELKNVVNDLRRNLDIAENTISELKNEVVALRKNAVSSKLPSPTSAQNVTVRRPQRCNERLSVSAEASDVTDMSRSNDRSSRPTSNVETTLPQQSSASLPTFGKQKKSYAQVAVRKQVNKPARKTAASKSGMETVPAQLSSVHTGTKTNVDGDGFMLVERKKKPRPQKTRNQRGTAPPTAATSTLQVVEPTIQLYLSRLAPQTSGASVIQYVQERCQSRSGAPVEFHLNRLESIRAREFKSYVLRVPARHKDMFLAPDFWPEGVVFRRYRESRLSKVPQ